ncbi:low temperature requirement protein A [Streptomyces sp. NPDC050549]|uniref:low temperature requirement protein A n=1 Tax=Streptomyces sp. NPDC050549 TaxID=3155406 RepID=UPI0034194F98
MTDATATTTVPAVQVRARATRAELFLDLVLAFGGGQIAHLLAGHHTWAVLGQCLLVLVPLWWAWVDVVMAMNAVHETNLQRVFLLMTALAVHGMAVAAPQALADREQALLYAGGYLALRLLIGEAIRRECALHTIHPYRAGLAFALVLFAAATLPAPWREVCWAFAVIAELVAPVLLSGHLRRLAFGVDHLPERFGTVHHRPRREHLLRRCRSRQGSPRPGQPDRARPRPSSSAAPCGGSTSTSPPRPSPTPCAPTPPPPSSSATSSARAISPWSRACCWFPSAPHAPCTTRCGPRTPAPPDCCPSAPP